MNEIVIFVRELREGIKKESFDFPKGNGNWNLRKC